jgi:hypothetical protein
VGGGNIFVEKYIALDHFGAVFFCFFSRPIEGGLEDEVLRRRRVAGCSVWYILRSCAKLMVNKVAGFLSIPCIRIPPMKNAR